MFKRDIKVFHAGTKFNYAKSETYETAITHSQRLSGAHADGDIYRLTTVHSIDNDRQKCLPDVDMFLESAHMDSVVCIPYEPSQNCAQCTTTLKEMRNFAEQRAGETLLWDYTTVLTSFEEKKEFAQPEFSVDDMTAGLDALVTNKHKHITARLKHTLDIDASKTDKDTDTKSTQLSSLSHSHDEYVKTHGGVSAQEFKDLQLSMQEVFPMFCKLEALSDTHLRAHDDTVCLVFNHYVDDCKYIKLMNALYNNDGMFLFDDKNIQRLFVYPAMSYELAVDYTVSLQSVQKISITEDSASDDNDDDSTDDDEGAQKFNELNVRADYIICGLRNYFGAIHVVIQGHVDSQGKTVAQAVSPSLHCIDYGPKSYEGTISSVHEYVTFVRQASRRIFSGFLCTRDICTAMLGADIEQGRDISQRLNTTQSAHNVSAKKESYVCLLKMLKHYGLIIDFNMHMSLGSCEPCADEACEHYDHKHTTVLYVDLESSHFVSHVTQFLNHANYLAHLCSTMSTHMRRVILGKPKDIMTQDDIEDYKGTEYFANLYAQVSLRIHTQFIASDAPAKFDFSRSEYVQMLKDIRFREYSFTQIHDIQRHSFNEFLRLHHSVNKAEYDVRSEPIYLFHIGDISIKVPTRGARSDAIDSTIALQLVREHMTKLSENNFRYKTHSSMAHMSSHAKSIHNDTLAHYTQQAQNPSESPKMLPLKLLSGKFHISHSSIGAMFSLENQNTLRVYMNKGVKLPRIHNNAEYVYYGAHSFAVTITGAFTKVLDYFGNHIEEARCICEHENADMCKKCLHNIVFCDNNSYARQYIDMHFETLLPYIITVCANYSFNGASTEGCKVDGMLFNDRANTIACGHSVEFLFCEKSHTMRNFRSHIDAQNNVREDIMDEIVNDSDFCVVLIEPISETYGPIKTDTVELFNKVLHLYYNTDIRHTIPVMSPSLHKTMLMSAYMDMILQTENTHTQEHKKHSALVGCVRSTIHHAKQMLGAYAHNSSSEDIYFGDDDLQKYNEQKHKLLPYTDAVYLCCFTCSDKK